MQRRSLVWKLGLLLMVHIVAVVKSQMKIENDVRASADGFTGLEESAFYALRSCHQVLRGDNGEFFSPDYLCSSPALWCNWTVQVNPGKRVQLYLEDLTPEHDCHLKADQIHLDESPEAAGESRILERCWRKVKYTSASNTVHVVQLIGANPNPPHRGFYGWYQTIGPLQHSDSDSSDYDESVDTSIREEVSPEEEDAETVVSDKKSFTQGTSLSLENMINAIIEPVEVIDDINSWTSEFLTPTKPWDKSTGEIRKTRGGAEDQDVISPGDISHNGTTFTDAVSTPPEGGASALLSDHGMANTHITTASSTILSPAVEGINTVTQTAGAAHFNQNKVAPLSSHSDHDMQMTDSDGGFLAEAEEYNGSFEENSVNSTGKPKTSHRMKGKSLPVKTFKKSAEPAHLPGSLLLEVTVEVDLEQVRGAWSLDHVRKSVSAAVENMIQKDLGNFNLKSISSKRAKKLSKGVLLITWVQLGKGDDEGRTYGVLQSTLQGLSGRNITTRGDKHGSIIAVSVEDVNECETQMVMCDVHAECVNEFGSYSCHCRHGYGPGLGGAVCVQPEAEDCSRTTFPIILYVVCFLLCFLITLLLVVLCVVYRRYHQGEFLPHCRHSSSGRVAAAIPEVNNNNHLRNDGGNGSVDPSSRLPPPPPPIRLPRGAGELPLLKFSPLVSPDGFEHKVQREKD